MKLLFWLAKGRRDSAGLAPIWARITVDGKSREISTSIKTTPSKWISKGNGYIKGNSDLTYLHNARLTDIRAQITEIHLDLLRRDQPITAQIIKDRFIGKHKANYSVLEVAHTLIVSLEEDPDYAEGTVRTYATRVRALRMYLESIHRTDMLCEEVEVQTGKALFTYMRKHGMKGEGVGIGHAQKCVRALKKVLDQAVAMKVIPGNVISTLRMKKPPAKPLLFLTEEEFAWLAEHKFRSKRLAQVRDLFVVQCCTGLAYAELAALSTEHFFHGSDSKAWLRMERAKVPGGFCRVPLMERTTLILERYQYQLPVIANGNYNAYLKEVAEIVGIEKNVTTHVARRTCGMLLLNRGVPMETISQILGHSSVRTTQEYYAQVLDEKIAQDMAGVEF